MSNRTFQAVCSSLYPSYGCYRNNEGHAHLTTVRTRSLLANSRGDQGLHNPNWYQNFFLRSYE